MNPDHPSARKDAFQAPGPVEEKTKDHPGGTTAGAAGGAVAGIMTGMGAGPIGAAAGAVVGAVAGAVRGSGVRGSGEVTVEREDVHWREHFASRPYASPGARYEDYGPAYRLAADEWLAHEGSRS